MILKDKKFLIAGSSGQLAREFISALSGIGANVIAPPEAQFDITDPAKVEAVIGAYAPDVLLNCAAYNLVDKAEEDPETAYKVNAEAVAILAAACKKAGVFPVHFGTDYIFDGKKNDLYTEDDKAKPLNVYGKSKLKGEKELSDAMEHFLIFRLSWVFGAGHQNFLYKLQQWAEGKSSLKIVSDEVSVPTFTEDAVGIVLKALENGLEGTFHLTNSGKASRYEWAKHYFQKKGIAIEVQPVSMAEFPVKARRPAATAMSNAKICSALGVSIPTWQEATDRFIDREKEKFK